MMKQFLSRWIGKGPSVKPLKLLAFDLDDTLFPEREFVKSGFGAVAQHLNNFYKVDGPTFFHTAWHLFENGVRGTIFNQALGLSGVASRPELIPELVDVYRAHQPCIQPFKEVPELLKELQEDNLSLALISDGPAQMQENKLTALGLAKYFQYIIFTASYGMDWAKPSPRSFEKVMKLKEAEADACVYIADNPCKDFVGPNRLGWRTIRICARTGLYINENPVVGGEPQQSVDNFAALRKLLLT
jgi:putative hydrolase of the HAD superfamily